MHRFKFIVSSALIAVVVVSVLAGCTSAHKSTHHASESFASSNDIGMYYAHNDSTLVQTTDVTILGASYGVDVTVTINAAVDNDLPVNALQLVTASFSDGTTPKVELALNGYQDIVTFPAVATAAKAGISPNKEGPLLQGYSEPAPQGTYAYSYMCGTYGFGVVNAPQIVEAIRALPGMQGVGVTLVPKVTELTVPTADACAVIVPNLPHTGDGNIQFYDPNGAPLDGVPTGPGPKG